MIARILTFCLCLFILSCANPDEFLDFEISADPIPEVPPPDLGRETQRLQTFAAKSPERENALRDVFHILEAEKFETRQQLDFALPAWLAAVKASRGRFSRATFERWIKAYKNVLGKSYDPKVLARLVLSETNGGADSEYLLVKGYINLESLERVIAQTLTVPLPAKNGSTTGPSIATRLQGAFESDPYFDKLAEGYCNDSENEHNLWLEWFKTLEANYLEFWQGKVAECRKQSDQALKHYNQALVLTLKGSNLQIHIAERIVQVHRAIGNREAAADAYVQLMKVLSDRRPQTKFIQGESALQFREKHINHALWAARYRAMVGDYLGAKGYATEAFNLLSRTYLEYPNLTLSERQKFTVLKAETYHTLAFRVSVEQSDYRGAYALSQLALQIPELDREWTERMAWYGGLYLYLMGNIDQAIKTWEALLKTGPLEETKPQLLFWLARLHTMKSQNAIADTYFAQLSDSFPLSFYATVAPDISTMKHRPWHERFGDISELKKALKNSSRAAEFRRTPNLARLAVRAEALVSVDIGEWSRLAVSELHAAMRKELPLSGARGAYISLSKMYYGLGSYNQAVGITTELAQAIPGFWTKYPEQLLIYFARPYADIIERRADELHLDQDWLYAVGRQESGFRPDAESPAGARGLLQLILPTAKRVAEEIGVNSTDLSTRLFEPATNIYLGATYLKTLARQFKGQESAIFGAYNGGEYAVESWLKRRAHADPLSWVELIPFGETKGYVRNVWRNLYVYRFLGAKEPQNWVTANYENLFRMSF